MKNRLFISCEIRHSFEHPQLPSKVLSIIPNTGFQLGIAYQKHVSLSLLKFAQSCVLGRTFVLARQLHHCGMWSGSMLSLSDCILSEDTSDPACEGVQTENRSNYVKWPKLYKRSENFFKTAIINKWTCHVRNNYHQAIIHYFHKNQSQKNQWSTRLLSQPKTILKPLNLYTFTSSDHKNNNGQRI